MTDINFKSKPSVEDAIKGNITCVFAEGTGDSSLPHKSGNSNFSQGRNICYGKRQVSLYVTQRYHLQQNLESLKRFVMHSVLMLMRLFK